MKYQLLIFLVLPLVGTAQTTMQLDHLVSFAKLYGYIKYFHPSDEAAESNWDQLSIHWYRKNIAM